MDADLYNPADRARLKAASRVADDAKLRAGSVSACELQKVNGGGGLFRNSRILRRPELHKTSEATA